MAFMGDWYTYAGEREDIFVKQYIRTIIKATVRRICTYGLARYFKAETPMINRGLRNMKNYM